MWEVDSFAPVSSTMMRSLYVARFTDRVHQQSVDECSTPRWSIKRLTTIVHVNFPQRKCLLDSVMAGVTTVSAADNAPYTCGSTEHCDRCEQHFVVRRSVNS